MDSKDNKTPFDALTYAVDIRRTVPYYDGLHLEVIDLVRTVRPDAKRWLDTGCGEGALIDKAAAYFPETDFWLADPAEAMLCEAGKRLKDVGRGRLVTTASGSEDLTLVGGERPDVITAFMAHHYFDPAQRRRATRRCFELLAEGGVYITFENIRPDSARGVEVGFDRWKRFQASRGRTPEAVRQHARRFDSAYFPIRVGEHLELLADCGFGTRELFWLSFMQGGFYAVKG